MELSRFLRPSILKFDDWFINVSIGCKGGEDSNIQKDVYFSGKNAYLYASTGSGVTELHIFGNSVQDGTPSIENPVPIISVGENYLQLYSLDINDPSKSGQIIDFGNIKLRSLPNGVCDEIVYQNGQWKHIQRIVSIIIDKNTTIQDQLTASNRVTIQVNYTLITKASANNTNLCSKTSNSASSVPRFHNYPNTIYVVWNSNKPATFEEAKSLIMGAEFCCELAEPVETILDLPKLQTLNGTTYLLTNDQQVKPYLQGYYDVDTTISGKKIEYVQDGMLSWWQPFGLTNADKPTVIPDKLGNSDLTIKNIGYTNESGFHPTYLQFDGIDDNANVRIKRYIGFIQAVVSDLNDNSNRNLALLSNWAGSNSINIRFDRNKLVVSNLITDSAKGYIDGEEVTSYNIVNGDGSIHTLAISNSKDDYDLHNISISNAFSSASNYFVKERFYEAIAYNRALTDEEVQSNFLVSQIRNGINIPNDIDPIDIISTPTYGSGKAFPVYNTYIDRNNNNAESLIICGYTEQDGTPTPENPIELKSVGDQSLVLCIYNEDKSKVQYIDFGDITLRSLPDGISDTIEWDGTQWKYIQRIEHIYIDGNINITKIANKTDLNISYVNIPVSIVNGQNVKPYSSMYCNRKLYRKNGYNIADSIFTVDANTYFYITYLNDTGEPYTSDDIKAINDEYPLDIYYAVNEPIETILEDLPAPQTYDQVTYFSTPNTEVRPYIMATVKAIKPLEYQGDISAWWYFGGNKSNETDRQITDISGNGNDLTPYNFAWTRESGWNQGSIHSDGIDDNLISNIKSFKSGLFITSDVWNSKSYIQYIVGIVIGTHNGGVIVSSTNLIGNANAYVTIEPSNVPSEPINIFLQKNNISDQVDKFRLFCFPDYISNYSTGNLHEYILFSTELTDDQILNNKKLITQRNGIEDHVNFTAIASGKKFPIYYTIEGDTIKELHIYGESMQEGTPTHDTPQEIYSSGDEGLKLCVTDSETGNALQVIDFGNIVLRSLPSGIRDEIVYKDGTWTYIQRVSAIVFSEFSNTEIAIRYENTETKEIIQVSIVNSAISHYCKNGTLCYCNSASPVLLLNPTDNNTVSYTINTGTSTGWRFGIQGITVDDIDAYVQDYKVQCEIETPIETTLDLPGITTYADITYIGTPNAKVKPYIECVAETYKSLWFVKDGLVELYDFAPSKWQDNKIYNEIDNSQYITANNFNNTVESGAFSNYTQFDGIDDYFTDNNNVDSIFFQIYATDLVSVETENRWLLAYDLGAPNTGLFINNNTYLICNNGLFSIDEGEKNNNISRDLWDTGIHSYQGFSDSVGSLSCIGNYNSGDFYAKYKLYVLLTYSSELTTEQIANNLNCFKQFKGIDGDIDISNESQLLDSQENELTDSQGYYLTVAS
jgi:hypothetical protein